MINITTVDGNENEDLLPLIRSQTVKNITKDQYGSPEFKTPVPETYF